MYWFILGRETILCAAEIAAVLNLKKVEISPESMLKTDQINDLPPSQLMNTLGGTIKIAKELGTNLSYDHLIQTMVDNSEKQTGKIEFGISVYGSNDNKLSESLGKAVKRIIKNTGKNARYVYNREPILSSVTVAKNGLDKNGGEFIVTGKEGKYSVAVTEAVQPFESFGARDYGRPVRDDESGMLPPKLAMMMINLAKVKPNDVILDPFCGSGTILTEAMLLGYKNLIGSDISEKAIADSQTNIAWLKNQYNDIAKQPDPNIFISNISDIASHLKQHTISAIIAEPYLGHPLRGRETEKEIRDQAEELKKLYLTAFAEFAKLLKPKGKVVFIIPRFKQNNGWITIDCIDEIKKIGFTTDPLITGHDYLLYARANQRVGREIWRFVKI